MPEEGGKTNPEQEPVSIIRDKFAQALDKIIVERDLGARLKEKPVETMAELGFVFDKPEVAKASAERLAEATATIPRVEGAGVVSEAVSGVVVITANDPATVAETVVIAVGVAETDQVEEVANNLDRITNSVKAVASKPPTKPSRKRSRRK
jgi:hypothetical protein